MRVEGDSSFSPRAPPSASVGQPYTPLTSPTCVRPHAVYSEYTDPHAASSPFEPSVYGLTSAAVQQQPTPPKPPASPRAVAASPRSPQFQRLTSSSGGARGASVPSSPHLAGGAHTAAGPKRRVKSAEYYMCGHSAYPRAAEGAARRRSMEQLGGGGLGVTNGVTATGEAPNFAEWLRAWRTQARPNNV